MRTEKINVFRNDANATPIRDWDYIANVEGDEEEGPYGYGCNEDEALMSLFEKLLDRGYV